MGHPVCNFVVPLLHVDLFPMSWCIATRWLVHNGGCSHRLFWLLRLCDLKDCTLQLRFYEISVELIIFGLQHSASNFGNPPLWTSLWRLVNGSISSWLMSIFIWSKRTMTLWGFSYDVIKDLIMQIMVKLPQILIWPTTSYNGFLYQIWSYLDERKQSYGP